MFIRLLVAAFALFFALSAFAIQLPPVAHGTPAVILDLPGLYDATNPAVCASGLTFASSGLEVRVRAPFSGPSGFATYTAAGSTLEDIANIGTFVPPSANKARFKIADASRCVYQLQLPDAAFAIQDGSFNNAPFISITVTDGGSAIMDTVYQVDLSPIDLATLFAGLMDSTVTSYTTVGTWGEVLSTLIPATHTATTTTIPNTLTSMNTLIGLGYEWVGAVDTGGVTSTTSIVVTNSPANDSYMIGSPICIQDASNSNFTDCSVISAYTTSNNTFTYEEALEFIVSDGDPVYIRTGDTNARYMNSAPICGTGTLGDLWEGCP